MQPAVRHDARATSSPPTSCARALRTCASSTASSATSISSPSPTSTSFPNTDKIDLTLTADEGKQFFVRRIDFSGNTTTRDKVIRREILLDEGDMFNTRLWDCSILRLNQLGYFEVLKKEDAADIKRNPEIQHRGHHAQGEGARQELDRPERRRLRYRRQLRRLQLLHQQLPRPGRDALAGMPARHAYARRQLRLHRALLPRPPAAARLRRLPARASTTIRAAKPRFWRART